MPDDVDMIFHALADPTRRALIEKLRQRNGLTLGELTAGSPLSRFGVMKHLAVLEAAGIVATKRAGRLKLHYLKTDTIANAYTDVIAPLLGQTLSGELQRVVGDER